ncbi:hypothetical protein SERLA73DRAFT_71231 [Serpula lacrymans var. lacrymans S7.3]|uniref:Uncharacterized protein n=2 Tax=Serpula lacrymans var. lacrymans TaxID=341189 RepID=F8PPM9_SERL3|nr:uncharacterized protein SERLADRAFT_414010 [Serpula lacrymans var. lacrymans S7.9]EGO02087.1 hypothetical protein SERLA73DRAFT_71231 [Serpula lacrymans var. lacrymans S7.3]EGO27713.1 hypothetical protein SERLADRAFT_414010 [Serpula lacrymans var. lacrymans S7.9]
MDTDAFHDIHLPLLDACTAPSTLLPFLVAETPVNNVTVFWEPDHHDYDDMMKVLANSAAPIRVLNTLRPGWSIDLARSVAKNLPSLTFLSIQNIMPILPMISTGQFMSSFEGLLPHFRNIEYLVITRVTLLDFYAEFRVFDRDLSVVIRWGNICPTLKVCVFPSGVVWHRIKNNAWIPEISHPLSEEWLMRTIAKNKYPVVEGYITEALKTYIVTSGKDDKLGLRRLVMPDSSRVFEWIRGGRRTDNVSDGDSDEDEDEDEEVDEDGDDRDEDSDYLSDETGEDQESDDLSEGGGDMFVW